MALALVLIVGMVHRGSAQRQAVEALRRKVQEAAGEPGFPVVLANISATLEEEWTHGSGPRKRLADVWREYRETLIETSDDGQPIRNAIRPGAFFNISNLGFGFRGWRFLPGLFVSVGLLLTFLGLIAALQQTSITLSEAGRGSGERAMADALNELLSVASAKFIMSLSGLFASILLIAAIRAVDARVGKAVTGLSYDLEDRLQFVSLEGLAQRQLDEAQETRAHMAKLNMALIEAIAEPLRTASKRGSDEAAQAMKELGRDLASGLGDAVTEASKRMETAASGMAETTAGLDAVARRIEMVSGELARAGEGLAAAAGPLGDSIKGTEDATRTIARTSVEMVEAASTALGRQSQAIEEAAQAIRQQVDAFEVRAKAYDGDMGRALTTYRENLDAAVDKVSRFSGEVHEDYADALQRLRSVIDGARSFEPSPPPPDGPSEDADRTTTPDENAA